MIVQNQKRYARKIDRKILALNVFVAALVGTIAVLFMVPSSLEVYLALLSIMFLFTFGILFFSVVRIRKTIKSIAYAFPNEKLIKIHFCNFPTWTVLVLADTALAYSLLRMGDVDQFSSDDAKLTYAKLYFWDGVVTNIQVVFAFWMELFLLYLIWRSTNDNVTERYGVKDLILGRKVPVIVFIKNKSLLQKIVTNEL